MNRDGESVNSPPGFQDKCQQVGQGSWKDWGATTLGLGLHWAGLDRVGAELDGGQGGMGWMGRAGWGGAGLGGAGLGGVRQGDVQ